MASTEQLAHTAVELWNSGDRQAYMSLYAEDVRWEGEQIGREAIGGLYDAWHEAFPDSHMGLHSIVCDGDKCACEMSFTATHTAPLVMNDAHGRGTTTLQPTGKTVNINWSIFLIASGGKLTSVAVYGIGAGLVESGVVPGVTVSFGMQPPRAGSGLNPQAAEVAT